MLSQLTILIYIKKIKSLKVIIILNWKLKIKNIFLNFKLLIKFIFI